MGALCASGAEASGSAPGPRLAPAKLEAAPASTLVKGLHPQGDAARLGPAPSPHGAGRSGGAVVASGRPGARAVGLGLPGLVPTTRPSQPSPARACAMSRRRADGASPG